MSYLTSKKKNLNSDASLTSARIFLQKQIDFPFLQFDGQRFVFVEYLVTLVDVKAIDMDMVMVIVVVMVTMISRCQSRLSVRCPKKNEFFD